MNTKQGATTGAAIVLAVGALFRPTVQTGPSGPPASPAVAQASSTKSIVDSKGINGPWTASCQYWAPVRLGGASLKDSPANISLTVKGTEKKLESHLQVSSVQVEAGCNGSSDPWGIPSKLPDTDASIPEITAITAIVPDPERGHSELDFDRTIDALMQAASDNGYVGSYYWLPWKPKNQLKGTSASAGDSSEDAERLKQPGLIVLKYRARPDDEPSLSFRRAIYVFLVADTPTQGVDGVQLQNAFLYETTLQSKFKASLSMRGNPGQPQAEEMDLILFKYSGAAASLREGIETALTSSPLHKVGIKTISITGGTSTEIASALLNESFHGTQIGYHSFAEDTSLQEATVTKLFQDEWQGCDRIAFLTEDGTVFGTASNSYQGEPEYERIGPPRKGKKQPDVKKANILGPCKNDDPLVLSYPRDISSLRNAREAEKSKEQSDPALAPYLHFSLKEINLDDSIPHFSQDQTPASEEAQLMAIGRRLLRSHVRTIAISATNVLDELFLAQFLHRACPDARLIFLDGGDLLVERDIDNLQYLGAITISPYNLVGLDHAYFSGQHIRAFPDSQSEAYYNAASFILWDGHRTTTNPAPWLAGYPRSSRADRLILRPLLWATAVGRDGYYPLGILDQCASNSEAILPDINLLADSYDKYASRCSGSNKPNSPDPFEPGVRVYPSLFWFALCILIILLCFGHSAVLLTANFWSPFTRDLAIKSGDMPRRRAVYVNIATAMLFCMGFVISYPLFPVFRGSMWSFYPAFWGVFTLIAASVSLLATLAGTYPYMGFYSRDPEPRQQPDRCRNDNDPEPARRKSYYVLLHVIACLTLLAVPVFWVIICEKDITVGTHTFAGLFFSYRCLHPESGVSPLLPTILLLFGWYLWGLCQTLRLRFSVNGRPQLPCRVNATTAYPLYVAEESLSRCETSQDHCLYRNITCLLITREIVRRFFRSPGAGLDIILAALYLALFVVAVFLIHVQGLDHFLWKVGFWPTLYEFLIRALFFPLMIVALTGWVRVIFIWTSLRRGLLVPLEHLPIRFAFNRLKGVAWMTMLRQGGLEEYWRDMARSTESMRQMIHSEGLRNAVNSKRPAEWKALESCNAALGAHIAELIQLIGDKRLRRRKGDSSLRKGSRAFLIGDDIPAPEHRDELNFMAAIERGYAHFCELLLAGLLIPYWEDERTGFVESEPMEMMPIKARRGTEVQDALELHAAPQSREEEPIRVAEEFLAIRYVSVIRAVLVNLRYTMVFVSMAFVLAILAWNSYPFRPQAWIDWMFTAVLIILGSGIVWVFAQMYRNPILSRITDTSANELGIEFYLRLAAFGAVPLLTWLAAQFPVIGTSLFHFLKPGLDIVK